MAYFGLKLGQDLGNRVAHPYQEFQGVPPPPLQALTCVVPEITQLRVLQEVQRRSTEILQDRGGGEGGQSGILFLGEAQKCVSMIVGSWERKNKRMRSFFLPLPTADSRAATLSHSILRKK